MAAAGGHADVAPLLITPATLDARDTAGYTALQHAVKGKRLRVAKELIAAGASPGAADFAASPLCMAFSSYSWRPSEQQELVLLLANAMAADPGSAQLVKQAASWRDRDDATALHHAAACGSQQLVVKLVEAGADKDALDYKENTPLWLAADNGHVPLVPLLATPTNINQYPRGQEGSPLHAAAALAAAGLGDKGPLVAALLAAGATANTYNAPRDGGWPCSALQAAAERGNAPVVALLLAALAKECGQQQRLQQQQQQQQLPLQKQQQSPPPPPPPPPQHQQLPPQKQQQQQQQQRAGQPKLASLVAAAVAPLARGEGRLDCCTKLLEVVLDVFGQEVAEEVCREVVQQPVRWLSFTDGAVQVSYLATALPSGLVRGGRVAACCSADGGSSPAQPGGAQGAAAAAGGVW
jgi:hypothetical protein